MFISLGLLKTYALMMMIIIIISCGVSFQTRLGEVIDAMFERKVSKFETIGAISHVLSGVFSHVTICLKFAVRLECKIVFQQRHVAYSMLKNGTEIVFQRRHLAYSVLKISTKIVFQQWPV